MARETLSIDGWLANATSNGVPIRDIELNEGLYSPPAPVGSNGSIANFTGELWRPKKHGAGKFVLNMWLIPNPAVTPNMRVALDAARDELYRVFQQTDRLLTFVRTMQSGEQRMCYGETVTLSASPIGQGNGGMRFAVEVNVPSAYWTSLAPVTVSTGASTATSRTLTLSPFQGSTAPLEDLTVTIQGGCTNPRVQDVTNADLTALNPTAAPAGSWFQFYGTIPNDAALVVNTSNWTVSGIGGDSVGGFTPSVGAITHNGGRFLTVSAPRPGRDSAVSFSAVNVSSTCNMTVTGKKYFQV